MIGGTVISTRPKREGVTEITVGDNTNTGQGFLDICCVCAECPPDLIRGGDRVWWQGGWIMWTTKDESIVEQKIPKVGFSYSPDNAPPEAD